MKFKIYDYENEMFITEKNLTIEQCIEFLNTLYFYEQDYVEFTKENLWQLLIDWHLQLIPIF